MTAELFPELAGEMAELGERDLKNLSIREHYGFVDVSAKAAEVLIRSLNGIEYNGQALPVEQAAVLGQKPPRRDGEYEGRGERGEGIS